MEKKYKSIMIKNDLYKQLDEERARMGLRTFTELLIKLLDKK